MPIKPIKLAPAREQVAQVLRQSILSGEYKPGELLTLDAVANIVGVSRTPVREAFQILASEDLIDLRPNRGAIVIGLSPEVVADHFDMRILLEGEAVYRACVNGVDLKLLERCCDEGSIAVKYNEIRRFTSANETFHTAIWEAAKSEKLRSFLSQLWTGTAVDQAVSKEQYMANAQKEHEELLRVLKTQNPDLARKVMENHLRQSKENALRTMHQISSKNSPKSVDSESFS